MPYFKWYIVGGVALALLVSVLRRKRPLKTHLTLWIIILACVGLLYSLGTYYGQGGENGIVVCSGTECYRAMHTHSQILATVCGQNIDFSKEVGDLGKQHTHKELNLIHFHDKVPIDAVTGEITNTTALQLGRFFEAVKIKFNSTCLADKCNGDACPDGQQGTLKMMVNGNESTTFEQYVWSDGDKIELTFG